MEYQCTHFVINKVEYQCTHLVINKMEYQCTNFVIKKMEYQCTHFVINKVEYQRTHFVINKMEYQCTHFVINKVEYQCTHFVINKVEYQCTHFVINKMEYQCTHFVINKMEYQCTHFVINKMEYQCAHLLLTRWNINVLFLFQPLRCRNLADPVIKGVRAAVICQFCKMSTGVYNPGPFVRNENMCVVCGNAYHGPSNRTSQAHLCIFHGCHLPHKMEKCFLCGNIAHQSVPALLCTQCSFGNSGKQCCLLDLR